MPNIAAVRDAAARIAGHARVTPVLSDAALDLACDACVFFKAEHLQRGGAFKFRGACNAVWSLDDQQAARGVVTHSSGNHGTALALAAATRGVQAHVVVPDGAVKAKLAAIAGAGAVLHRCAATQASREQAAANVVAATGGSLVHPYADARVIAGQGTAALELLQQVPDLEVLLTPMGGGGLIAGTAMVAAALHPGLKVMAAEPEGAADAIASLAAGHRVTDIVPDTLCDGLRATLGEVNLKALQSHGVTVLPVSDEETIAAMRRIWRVLKQTVEPSSATVLAALLRHHEHFAGKRVGVILTGGNVDLEALPW
ncbi:pyridoxal-phosphate dependent enzyme [Oleiagrimonas sp. C23AA]|nr:pyridoxal-phosphate dependent enzyme [Oleiagrimonas sp. C23AA]NII12230.1 pyridoxal-phosphate dependent enzyme [Oleiagrimonas sp. C23AA]